MNDIIGLAEALPTAGAVVYWRLEGPLDVSALAAEWKAAGLPEDLLPSTPAPSTALTRAVHEQARGRVLVRPLAGKKGYALVQEKAEGEDLSHDVNLRVKLDAIGRPTFALVDGGAPSWTLAKACAHPLAPVIAAAYEKHLLQCDADDVSAWLTRLATKFVDGLGLRPGGGMYFVPPAHTATWDLIVSCLTEVSAHRGLKFPAMRGADAVTAVLDAVEQEARREFDRMFKDIGETALGETALDNRYDELEAVEAKVARYEALLGTRLESFQSRAEELRAALAVAMLKAESAAAS